MLVPVPHVPTLTSALDVLSAMITPAVLIMACGSLILTTSSRLIRAVDRVREFMPEMESLATEHDESGETKRRMVLGQLERLTSRARLLQRALALLYSALGTFVATSVAIGIIALLGIRYAALPLILGFIGAGLLFYASVLLIIESRIALAATYDEMDYVTHLGQKHTAPRQTLSEAKRELKSRVAGDEM
jgi:hypothetical protein